MFCVAATWWLPVAATHYLPREDVDMAALERTDHASHCPLEGDTSYYSVLQRPGRR